MKRVFSLAILSVGGLLLTNSTNWSHAADPATAKPVKLLLQDAWVKNSVRASEYPNYPSLNNPPLSTNASVVSARWLVQMYHGRYADALTTLKTVAQSKPADDLNLAALRAATWIHTFNKEYPQALMQADKLGQAATPNPPAVDADIVKAQDEAITFLGRIAGFLEGPCEKPAKFEEQLLQRLDERRKKLFSDAKAETLAKFTKLSADFADAKSKSLQDAEAERQQELADLDRDLQKMIQDSAKLEAQKKQVRKIFDDNLDALNREDLPLQQSQVVLQGQIVAANQNVTQAEGNVQNVQQQMNNAKDAATRQRLQNDLRQANNNLINVRNVLTQLNTQAAALIRQRQAVEQKKVRLDRDATAETKKIEKQLLDLESDQKKLERKIADTKKSKIGPSRKVLNLETELRTLKTYNEFPLQELRDAWLAKLQ